MEFGKHKIQVLHGNLFLIIKKVLLDGISLDPQNPILFGLEQERMLEEDICSLWRWNL